MDQMDFKILKRAQSNAKDTEKLISFFKEKGVTLEDVKGNPTRYEDLIKQYSKSCVNVGLFEESRDRLELEFNRLCEYHRIHEATLAQQFYDVAKEIILTSPVSNKQK